MLVDQSTILIMPLAIETASTQNSIAIEIFQPAILIVPLPSNAPRLPTHQPLRRTFPSWSTDGVHTS